MHATLEIVCKCVMSMYEYKNLTNQDKVWSLFNTDELGLTSDKPRICAVD